MGCGKQCSLLVGGRIGTENPYTSYRLGVNCWGETWGDHGMYANKMFCFLLNIIFNRIFQVSQGF